MKATLNAPKSTKSTWTHGRCFNRRSTSNASQKIHKNPHSRGLIFGFFGSPTREQNKQKPAIFGFFGDTFARARHGVWILRTWNYHERSTRRLCVAKWRLILTMRGQSACSFARLARAPRSGVLPSQDATGGVVALQPAKARLANACQCQTAADAAIMAAYPPARKHLKAASELPKATAAAQRKANLTKADIFGQSCAPASWGFNL
jgi:hypothetical protein